MCGAVAAARPAAGLHGRPASHHPDKEAPAGPPGDLHHLAPPTPHRVWSQAPAGHQASSRAHARHLRAWCAHATQQAPRHTTPGILVLHARPQALPHQGPSHVHHPPSPRCRTAKHYQHQCSRDSQGFSLSTQEARVSPGTDLRPICRSHAASSRALIH